MKILKLSIYSLLFISLVSCGSKNGEEQSTESSEAKPVKIGNLTWTAENLNVDKFNNGEAIPEAKTAEEWTTAYKEKKAAWCYYDNSSENGKKFGKLYNWFAVADSTRGGLAPKGYRVPNNLELATFVDEYKKDAYLTATKLKANAGWPEKLNGDNASGFNALPSGSRSARGDFGYLGTDLFLWSKTANPNGASGIIINDMLRGNQDEKGCGYSVRLIKE